MRMRARVLGSIGLVASAAGLPPAAAQRGPDSVVVVADSTFLAGGLHRWLYGSHYRELWAQPIKVEVLDLRRFAGGLVPVRRGGGLQTRSLRFRGTDGKEYAFRSVRKDPAGIVPLDLRGTFVEGVVRDQMSAVHPGGALVVPPILEAAGVLHTPPVLRVMPHDPRLGEFRAEFGGMLGTIEERPVEADDDSPGFAGAARVEDTDKLIEALWNRPWVRVDSRAFLTARLLDLYLGDWDRHEDQWSWALIGTEDAGRWVPIPRDRDQVFARYDGLLFSIARQATPQLLSFGEDYAKPVASTWNGRNLDRRLLTDLEWATWDSISRVLTTRITDSVIDAAIDRLPSGYEAEHGATLRRLLRIRRDKLPEATRRFYDFLAGQVAVHGGDRDDWAEITRQPDGRTEVLLGRARTDQWYFRRTFVPDETEEIRIYLRDGDDRAMIRGSSRGPLVRIVGGDDRDTLINESGSDAEFYDHGGGTVARGASLDRKSYGQPADTNAVILPERDWGSMTLGIPRFLVNSDVGVSLGYAILRRGFGFRRQPYATQLLGSAEYSFLRKDFRVQLGNRWKVVGRDTYWTVDLLASGLEGLRFYGFGNNTVGEAPDDDVFLVRQKAYGISVGPGFGLEGRTRFQVMVRARHTVTDPDDSTNANGIIGQQRPLGFDEFGQLGLASRFEFDSRDYRFGATKGVHLMLEGSVYPVTWSTDADVFGAVEGFATTYLTPVQPGWVTVALRVGGRQAWGDFPYFEAAYLGASESLRGYPRNRFAGDAAVFGNAELRLRLARTKIILPGEFGVFGLADAGRVWFEGDDNDDWHTDFGGGIFFGFRDRMFAFSAGLAKGDEKQRFYLGVGLGY
ncbi:MAG TPA: BamA/TamA family outer membrane protein [Gemmatimonadales bacterium]